MSHVVVDSSCDLPQELVDRFGITVVPMSIRIDGDDYREGVDITTHEFYARMARSTELPKTSQPSPAAFAETFAAHAAEGPVLCLTVSSKLSGTYQSACLGGELSGADVTVFDSLTASAGLGLQVLKACELFDAGRTVADVVAKLTAYRDKMKTLVLLSTLENIVKGGRLSRFQGSLGKILDIRVLLHDVQGEVDLLEKVHGRRRLLERTLERIRALRPDLSDRVVGLTHFNNPTDVETLKQALAEQCHPRGFVVNEMGSAIATYAGEGGVIVSF